MPFNEREDVLYERENVIYARGLWARPDWKLGICEVEFTYLRRYCGYPEHLIREETVSDEEGVKIGQLRILSGSSTLYLRLPADKPLSESVRPLLEHVNRVDNTALPELLSRLKRYASRREYVDSDDNIGPYFTDTKRRAIRAFGRFLRVQPSE